MKQENQNYKITIDVKKEPKKGRSAWFDATINLIMNNKGIILAKQIMIKNGALDLYTTSSWFKGNKEPNFKRREKLFNELNLKQEKRPTSSCHNIHELNKSEIDKLNDFFNNPEKYDSTIKNVVAIFKGNNPTGEHKKPLAAELVMVNERYANFTILLDSLKSKIDCPFDIYAANALPISLNEFIDDINESQEIKIFFEYFNKKDNNPSNLKKMIEEIKQYKKKYDLARREYIKEADQERTRYTINIKKYIQNFGYLPFNFSNESEMDKIFQKCHIYNYCLIRDKYVEHKINNNTEQAEKYKKMISDYHNFIPLDHIMHNLFDKNWFSYDSKTRKIIPLTNDGEEFIIEKMDHKYYEIPAEFMTKERKKYFEIRNSENQNKSKRWE